MGNETMFSLIIPSFNRAELLKRTIHSALNQDYRNLEVIVLDDGSTDNTEEVVRSIGDERIRYYKKENEERGAARNYGTRLARGAYIVFLDSDDIVRKDHLTEAAKAVARYHDPEIFCSDYDMIAPDGKVLKKVRPGRRDINTALLSGNILSCSAVFLRKDVALKYPFMEDRALAGSEDWVLWLQLASRYKIYCTNTATAALTAHPRRSVLSANAQTLVAREELVLKYLQADPAFMAKYGTIFGSTRAHLAMYIALHAAICGDKACALRYLGKAIRSDPRIVFTKKILGVLKCLVLSDGTRKQGRIVS